MVFQSVMEKKRFNAAVILQTQELKHIITYNNYTLLSIVKVLVNN